MSPRKPERSGERGAALLMTLLLVAALSTVAVAMSDSLRIAARRASNAEARDQAVWYLLGAETLAQAVLKRDAEASPDRTTLDAPWARGPVAFDIDGGRIEGVISDRSNCFNLNSLAKLDEDRGYVVEPATRDELAALGRALDVAPTDATRFAAAAADWIDSDEAPSAGGAEDIDYAGQTPPYRAANGPFAEVEEARALAGVDEALFRRLRPYLCAYPEEAPATLNVNTLRRADAPLLVALFRGGLSDDAAREVIASRPAAGWGRPEEFWALEPVRALTVDEAVRGRIAVTSRYFALRARVAYNAAEAESTSLLVRTGSAVRVARRRIGGGE